MAPGASAAIENATTSRYSNAATLQGKTQDQSFREEKTMDNKSKGHGAKDNNPSERKARKCVGGDIHEFKECPCIVSSIRTSDWKEVKKMGNLIRQQIQKNEVLIDQTPNEQKKEEKMPRPITNNESISHGKWIREPHTMKLNHPLEE